MKLETLTGEPGLRLDAFLARRHPEFSRGYWQKRIAAGAVRVAGQTGDTASRLKGGEVVEVSWGEGEAADLSGRVLFEDQDILILDKPSGLIVHPLGSSWLRAPEALKAEEPTLVRWLWESRKAPAGLPRFGLVHRLDRGTSGVLVVAKSPAALDSLLAQFRDRQVEKRYRALVLGSIRRESLEVDEPVGRSGHVRRVGIDPYGRSAKTRVEVLRTCALASDVEARPLTGRTHQIRVHLAHAGHPVLGDVEWVGPDDSERLERAGLPRPRLMLHAWKLSFTHPASGKRVTFEASLPKDFRDYWKALAGAGTSSASRARSRTAASKAP